MASQNLSYENLITGIYQGLFRREADPSGARHAMLMLQNDPDALQKILTTIIESDEFRSSQGQSNRFTNDVSQHGEIWSIIRTWVNNFALERVVVDVGARGRERSNSYDLLKHFGWRGLLVEANPHLLAGIEAQFAGLDWRLVSCAVSDYEGTATFTVGNNDDVSSLNGDLAVHWGATRGSFDVQVRRLQTVLTENGIPHAFDFLSLDIEGEDVKVFNDLVGNSAYRPRWVMIETGSITSLSDVPFCSTVTEAYQLQYCVGPNAVLSLART